MTTLIEEKFKQLEEVTRQPFAPWSINGVVHLKGHVLVDVPSLLPRLLKGYEELKKRDYISRQAVEILQANAESFKKDIEKQSATIQKMRADFDEILRRIWYEMKSKLDPGTPQKILNDAIDYGRQCLKEVG